MALRLFRLKRTPQPGPAPGSPSAPSASDPTDPMAGTRAPPVVLKPKAKRTSAAKPKAKPAAGRKAAKKKR